MTEPETESAAEPMLSTADLAGTSATSTQAVSEARSFEPAAAKASDADDRPPLLEAGEADGLRGRWDTIQASFVDEPRTAVKDADALVAQAMKRLAETFAQERSGLEAQWARGDDVSTEDLRQALRRYRAFFERLLAV